jgi:hypothetical protein
MPPPPPLRKLAAIAAFSLAVALAAGTASVHAAPHSFGPGPRCGGTLWRLMTLSDAERMRVDLHGIATTIPEIATRRTPSVITPHRTTQFQKHVWRLRAVVDRYRIASNGEIILILFDIDSGAFMDAYLPAEACLGPDARDRTGMLAARNELTSRCPTVTWQWQLLGITVEIGGVGFWNPVRTTRGALPSGAELRPVTNLKVVTGCGVGQR